ncbi:hypothetical protein ABMA32_01295 [Mesorhizobium sp. VNQ89]|uniref:hypothetical protein n=1 Tax=Mesorhizobium quangtriensis TaxID=3157709 RepID=UPI0032B757A3
MLRLLLCLIGCFAWFPAASVTQEALQKDHREVEIAVRSSYVRTALARHTTLHLKVTDCRGRVKRDFILLYYDGLHVNGTSPETSKRLKEVLPWNGLIRLVAQFPENLFSERGKLCGELHGGSMIGVALPKYEVEIIE